ILGGGSLGFGEEFMKGNILVEGDLQELIKMGYGQSRINFQLSLKEKLKIFYNYISSLGTVINSKRNISYHYDIGNDFYSLWLDSTLTYSCAYFKKEDDSLERAQLNKYEHVSKKLQLKQGETLVDIGCGWGGMMFYAAENYGVKCEGYTLSQKQYDHIIEEIKKRNLADFVKVYLKDYREARGKFDKFVSIGMFEHVGKKFHPVFFDVVKKILKPEGIGLLQTIGSPKDKPSDPWITKYIFPGGFIPALPAICNIMNQKDLVFFEIEDLRQHYALTLDKWIEGFEENIDKIRKALIKPLGGEKQTEEFVRMWRLYLNGSSVSFKAGNNHLYQITFSNGLNNQLHER
ncbi:MAG: SAM-dependent methyltransferase, partial [Candidatus Nealsonbacteria bacterium CG18_big_fil_WC_8_21_14_2_50_37_10]